MNNILAFVAVFGTLVLVHELGHFIAARVSGVRVDEFGFGWPPRLLKLGTWKGTAITLNLLPLGGFVRVAEDDPTVEGSLASKNRRTRAFVHSAGALMNLVLAFLLFSATYLFGTLVPVDRPGAGIYMVAEGSPAEEAGIAAGDNIVRIAGQEVQSTQDVVDLVAERLGEPTEFVIQTQGGDLRTLTMTPRANPPEGEGALGVSLDLPFALRSYPAWEALRLGARTTVNSVRSLFTAIGAAIRRQMDLQLTGVIGMYTMTAEVAQTGLVQTLTFTGWLSVNLFLLNLLPLPALDGGKLVFILLEWIRGGKRVAPEKEGMVHAVGMLVLIVAMVAITVVDYMRYVG